MNKQQEILLEADGLGQGQSRRIVCPFCRGGWTGEASMNITNRGADIAFHCHRATCNASGYAALNGAYHAQVRAREGADGPEPLERVYTGPVLPLTDEDFGYFWTKYELAPTWVRGKIMRAYTSHYILPALWNGEQRGLVIRVPWDGAPLPVRGATTPKADLYLDPSKPGHANYTLTPVADEKSIVVIVEDQLSAMKVAENDSRVIAVALLGSVLNQEKVREIAMLRPSEVILAMDSDATSLAFRYAKEWGMAFRNFRVAILDQDIKDTKHRHIAKVLGL